MLKRRLAASAASLVAAVFLWNCGAGSPAGPSPGGGGGGGTVPPPGPVRVLAAGDVGECGFGAMQTGALLDATDGLILALGDLAYFQGSMANFRDCYDPAWGRHQDRTRPVPGNHEYESPGASSYYDYFGDLAGPRGLGYYAFTAGAWRIIALNSGPGGSFASAGSAQAQWLRTELETNKSACTLAYWHHPLFSSGPNGNQPTEAAEFWRILSAAGVDVVLNAHDHFYERFAPQDPDGRPSPNGIREFIVGTGGAHLYTAGTQKLNSERRGSAYGFLLLTLSATSYQWEFKSVGNTFSDTGTGTCH
jgi:acid phosphatase type 7